MLKKNGRCRIADGIAGRGGKRTALIERAGRRVISQRAKEGRANDGIARKFRKQLLYPGQKSWPQAGAKVKKSAVFVEGDEVGVKGVVAEQYETHGPMWQCK